MNCKRIFEELNRLAPLTLSDELVKAEGGYDNSGIIVGNDGEINKALFCLDLTRASVSEAIKVGANLIVTHHPAIYRPIKSITETAPVYECIANGIAVISMHLNLDCARRGIDYSLAEGLGGKVTEIITPLGKDVGYGRISETNGATAGEIFRRYKEVFSTDKGEFYGDETRKIRLMASFCGAGLDDNALDEAIKRGAQLVVSADIPHHVLVRAIESGLAVVNCTHYASENYGMEKFAEDCREQLKNLEICFYRDGRFA